MSQIKKKFIGDNEVGADKIRLENNSALQARNAANSADIDVIKVDAADAILVYDGAANVSIDAKNRQLINTGADISLDYEQNKLYDTSVQTSLDWQARKLYDNAAGESIDYSNAASITVSKDILPNSNNTKKLGSSINNFSEVNAISINSNTSLGFTSGAGIEFYSGSENIFLYSFNGLVSPTLYFYEATSTNSVGFAAPSSLATTYTLTLPTTAGTNGYVLSTDGAGVLSWVAQGTGITWGTAVNDDIIPDTDVTYDLGAAGFAFDRIYVDKISSTTSPDTMDVSGRILKDSAGSASITFSSITDVVVAKNIKPDLDATHNIGTSGTAEYNDVYAASFGSSDRLISLGAGDASATIEINNYGVGAVAPRVGFADYTNGFRAYVKAPTTLTANYTLTLPDGDGTNGQVLQTDGSGVLSWVTPSSGGSYATETFVLAAGDITNQYITLANSAIAGSVHFAVRGAPVMFEGASYDYSVSGAQVNFLNDIATGGPSALVAGDIVQVKYAY